MRTKNIWLIISLILVIVFGTGYAVSVSSYGFAENVDRLVLEVQSNKKSYLPGEIISLRFRVVNKSNSSAALYKGFTVQDGNLKVFIAYDNGAFKEYFGPGWGTKDAIYGEPIRLAPNQLFETEATILWNQKLETSHLSKMYAKSYGKERINTDYALTNPGIYYIKAALYNPLSGNTVESEPVSIIVEEPQGDDLETWNKIKEDGKYGLFIQTGGLIEHPKGRKTIEVINNLEKILSLHQNSRYADSIRFALSKHQKAIEQIEKKE